MNLSQLNNITPYTVNNSLINDSTQIGTNLVSNANTTTEGFFGLGVLVIIYIFLMFLLMSDGEVFRFRFVDATIITSAIVTILGILGLVGDIFSSFQHIIWFALILLIFSLVKYYQNEG